MPSSSTAGLPGDAAPGPSGNDGGPVAVRPVMTQLDMHAEFQRADFSLALGKPAEAARILEPVVAAEPTNQAALELLARAYFGAAQLGRAEEALTRLVDLAPANAWARRALARTLERQSRPDDAAVHHRVADVLGAA
jgi:predicted Zn-dependent protease